MRSLSPYYIVLTAQEVLLGVKCKRLLSGPKFTSPKFTSIKTMFTYRQPPPGRDKVMPGSRYCCLPSSWGCRSPGPPRAYTAAHWPSRWWNNAPGRRSGSPRSCWTSSGSYGLEGRRPPHTRCPGSQSAMHPPRGCGLVYRWERLEIREIK